MNGPYVSSSNGFQYYDTASATANTANSSTTPSLLAGMTKTPPAGVYFVSFSTTVTTTLAANATFALYVGGVLVAHTVRTVPHNSCPSFTAFVTVAGNQAIEVRWNVDNGASVGTTRQRTMTLLGVGA